MVTVQKNKNSILFSLINNLLLSPDVLTKTPTDLAMKVFNHYKGLGTYESAKKYIQKYRNIPVLKINYQYSVLSLYIKDDLTFDTEEDSIKELLKNDEYNEHLKVITDLLPRISKEMNFDTYYEKEILPEYEKICRDVQLIFSEKEALSESMINLWELDKDPELIFIPNFIATGDCFGINNKMKFYSISSAKINKENGKREFYPRHVLSNAIHEFSHSFINQSIEENNIAKEIKTLSTEKISKIKEISLLEDLVKIYGSGYFMECFDRAITLYIQEKNDLFNIPEGYFKDEKERGYYFTEEFYKSLSKEGDKSPILLFLEILKKL